MFCDQLSAVGHLLCTRDGTPGSLILRGSAPSPMPYDFIYRQLLREKLFNCCENIVFKT